MQIVLPVYDLSDKTYPVVPWEESIVPVSCVLLVAPPTAEPQVTENNPAAVVAVCKKIKWLN